MTCEDCGITLCDVCLKRRKCCNCGARLSPVVEEGTATPPVTKFKPIFQTIKEPLNGNCFQACVASIFGLSLDSVPHFMANSAGHKWTQEQWDAVLAFAAKHKHAACWINNPEEPELVAKLIASDLHYIAIGPSRAGNWGHCVVQRKGQNVHDPAAGEFLNGEPWTFVVFEPVADPATPPENMAYSQVEHARLHPGTPVYGEVASGTGMMAATSSAPGETAREPHDGWMNTWLFKNSHRYSTDYSFWQPEVRKMAGDWADFRVAHESRSLRQQLERERKDKRQWQRISASLQIDIDTALAESDILRQKLDAKQKELNEIIVQDSRQIRVFGKTLLEIRRLIDKDAELERERS